MRASSTIWRNGRACVTLRRVTRLEDVPMNSRASASVSPCVSKNMSVGISSTSTTVTNSVAHAKFASRTHGGKGRERNPPKPGSHRGLERGLANSVAQTSHTARTAGERSSIPAPWMLCSSSCCVKPPPSSLRVPLCATLRFSVSKLANSPSASSSCGPRELPRRLHGVRFVVPVDANE